jgi:hypothetical protein
LQSLLWICEYVKIIQTSESDANQLVIDELAIERIKTFAHKQTHSVLHPVFEKTGVSNSFLNQRLHAFSCCLRRWHVSLEFNFPVLFFQMFHLEAFFTVEILLEKLDCSDFMLVLFIFNHRLAL